MEKPIRTSAKAVLIRDGRLLCIEHTDENGVFYGLPGGGQHKYETLPQAPSARVHRGGRRACAGRGAALCAGVHWKTP